MSIVDILNNSEQIISDHAQSKAQKSSKFKRTYLIPLGPLSSNHLYATRVVRAKWSKAKPTSPYAWTSYRYPTDACKDLKMHVTNCMKHTDRDKGKFPFILNAETLQFRLYVFLEGLRYKNGNMRKKDTSGFIKAIEDAVSDHLGIGDEQNVTVWAKKFRSDGDFMIIEIIKDPLEPYVSSTEASKLVGDGLFSSESLACLYLQE